MPISLGVGGNFATEQPVDDSEVRQRQAHADGPPREAHTKRVRTRNGASDRQVVTLRKVVIRVEA